MKLIFLDIDGTLTEAGLNTPPESALKAIGKAREKGNKVFLCSGRNIGMNRRSCRGAFFTLISR